MNDISRKSFILRHVATVWPNQHDSPRIQYNISITGTRAVVSCRFFGSRSRTYRLPIGRRRRLSSAIRCLESLFNIYFSFASHTDVVAVIRLVERQQVNLNTCCPLQQALTRFRGNIVWRNHSDWNAIFSKTVRNSIVADLIKGWRNF